MREGGGGGREGRGQAATGGASEREREREGRAGDEWQMGEGVGGWEKMLEWGKKELESGSVTRFASREEDGARRRGAGRVGWTRK